MKNIFSSLDFTSGYWQIPLDPSFVSTPGFCMMRGHTSLVLSFVLNISNASFGKGLEAAFNNSTVPCPFLNDLHTYVDDILVSYQSFQKISIAGFTLKFKKCNFVKSQIKFLGHFLLVVQ